MKNSLESLAGSLGLNTGNSVGKLVDDTNVNPDLYAVYSAEAMEARKDLEGFVLLIGIATQNANPTYSTEGFKEVMHKLGEMIKEFFKKIGNFLKKLWMEFKGFFSRKAHREYLDKVHYDKIMKIFNKMAKDVDGVDKELDHIPTIEDIEKVNEAFKKHAKSKLRVTTGSISNMMLIPKFLKGDDIKVVVDKMVFNIDYIEKLKIGKHFDEYIKLLKDPNTTRDKFDEHFHKLDEIMEKGNTDIFELSDGDKDMVPIAIIDFFNKMYGVNDVVDEAYDKVNDVTKVYDNELDRMEKEFEKVSGPDLKVHSGCEAVPKIGFTRYSRILSNSIQKLHKISQLLLFSINKIYI